jgi:predicted metal-dependent peptidase
VTGSRLTTGGFTRDQLDDLAAARLLALERMPYLATALFEVIPLASPGLGTFGVDAAWRLYVDPQQLADWGPRQAAGVLLHEVGHLLRDHHARFIEQAVDRPRVWNLAGDAEINDDLIAAGVPLPGEPVTPSLFGQPDGQLAERYFHHLLAELHDLEVACGSGAGGEPLPCELGEDDAPARSALDQDLVRRKVAHDIQVATAGAGTAAGAVPGGWRRWAAEVLRAPVVRWETLLRRTIRRSLAVRAGQLDASYRRPGRRRIPDVVTPGLTRPVLRVGVVLDTSSSMANDQLDAALAELDAI